MRTNKERVRTLLGVIMPQFLKELMKRAKAELKDNVNIIHEDNSLQILFNFAEVKCRKVYEMLGAICKMFNTKGLLNKLTVELAKTTNIAETDGNFYEFEKRGATIYRSIKRYL